MVQNRHTFADSAYVTLVVAGEDLHYKDLAEKILEGGFFVSRGKTPAQTLRSQISREITTRGDLARFVNHDQGMISVSDFARKNPDEELVERVKAFAERQLAKASGAESAPPKKPAAKKAVAEKPAAPKVEAVAPKAEVVAAKPEAAAPKPVPAAPKAEAPPAPEVVAAPPAPEPVAPKLAQQPSPSSSIPEPDTGTGVFIPVELEEASELDDEEFVTDGTFATAEHEVFLLEETDAEEEGGEEAGGTAPSPSHFREDDSEQDFLSVGPDLGEMTSSEYDASMVELAPLVVPPYEGGAVEIARLPLGGRTVLVVKVVRRGGQPQIQLVEELESLVAGAVGRLLLTLPGEDVEDLLGAMVQVKRVIAESFLPGGEDDAEGMYLR